MGWNKIYIYIYIYNIYNVWLPLRLFEETRKSISLKHTSTYAWYIVTLVDINVFKRCRPHCNVAALRGTDNGFCHFHCTVLAARCSAGVCLCLFLALNVVYLPIYAKLGLVVSITKQMLWQNKCQMVWSRRCARLTSTSLTWEMVHGSTYMRIGFVCSLSPHISFVS